MLVVRATERRLLMDNLRRTFGIHPSEVSGAVALDSTDGDVIIKGVFLPICRDVYKINVTLCDDNGQYSDNVYTGQRNTLFGQVSNGSNYNLWNVGINTGNDFMTRQIYNPGRQSNDYTYSYGMPLYRSRGFARTDLKGNYISGGSDVTYTWYLAPIGYGFYNQGTFIPYLSETQMQYLEANQEYIYVPAYQLGLLSPVDSDNNGLLYKNVMLRQQDRILPSQTPIYYIPA